MLSLFRKKLNDHPKERCRRCKNVLEKEPRNLDELGAAYRQWKVGPGLCSWCLSYELDDVEKRRKRVDELTAMIVGAAISTLYRGQTDNELIGHARSLAERLVGKT